MAQTKNHPWHSGISTIPLFLLAFFICLSCRTLRPAQPQVADGTSTSATMEEKGIVYGKGGDVDLKLDLSRPTKGKGPFPAVVFVFGGGWGYYPGNRTQCPYYYAAQNGYVGVTVDYRLTSVRDENGKVKYPFPAQIEDVKAAIRWLRANAAKYDIDPDHIGVMGWSSGGHLALLAGMTNPSDDLEGNGGNANFSSSVQAVVCMAGLVEAVSFHNETDAPLRVELLLGGTPADVPGQYGRASPISYARKDNPPVLFIQGDVDRGCPPSQAQKLYDKMTEVGAPCVLEIKTGRGHVSFYEDDQAWALFDKYLKVSVK